MTDQPLPMDPPRRPRHFDHATLVATATALLPDIVEWLSGDYRESDRADLEEQLIEAMKDSCGSLDGYDIAKNLDNRFLWACDAELVEILDSAHSIASSELDKRVKEWVAANGITPKLEVGSRVTSAQTGMGWITAIKPEIASYIVQTEEWREKHPGQPASCGFIVAYEDLRLVTPA